MRFRSGALGVMEVTMLTYPKNLEGSITLLGEKGAVKIGGTAVNRVEHWQFAEYDDDDKLVELANTNPTSVYGFGHEPYYRNVLAVIRGRGAARDRRSGRPQVARAHPRHLRVCPDGPRGADPPALPVSRAFR
jgi:UDP-N-acetyl-2-amino-2-deoxyglucuronate dehydrogenase